jgi:hypothetical protein
VTGETGIIKSDKKRLESELALLEIRRIDVSTEMAWAFGKRASRKSQKVTTRLVPQRKSPLLLLMMMMMMRQLLTC